MKPRAFPFAVALWAFAALAWPDLKLGLGLIGASPGSQSAGANLFLAEAGALIFGLWVLADGHLRRRVPRWAWAWGAAWIALLALASAWGLHRGWHPRDVAAEARSAALALAFWAFSSLDPAGRRLLASGLLGGTAIWALQQALLMACEPTGLSNLNIVPVAVLASSHDLGAQALLGFVVLGAGLAWGRGQFRGALLVLLGLWALIWLSFLRALWLALPLAGAVTALVLARTLGWRRALAWAGLQLGAAVMSLSLLLLLLRALAPDAGFLLGFRLQRTAHALHLAVAPERPDCPGCGPLLRKIVARGGLYHSLADQDRGLAQPLGTTDASGSERGQMLRGATAAFLASPWLGEGLGSLLRYRVPPQIERVQRDPHSGAAWFLMKLGLAGLLFVVATATALGRALWTSRAPAAEQAFAAGVLALALGLEAFQAGLLIPSYSLACLAWAQVLRGEGSRV